MLEFRDRKCELTARRCSLIVGRTRGGKRLFPDCGLFVISLFLFLLTYDNVRTWYVQHMKLKVSCTLCYTLMVCIIYMQLHKSENDKLYRFADEYEVSSVLFMKQINSIIDYSCLYYTDMKLVG